MKFWFKTKSLSQNKSFRLQLKHKWKWLILKMMKTQSQSKNSKSSFKDYCLSNRRKNLNEEIVFEICSLIKRNKNLKKFDKSFNKKRNNLMRSISKFFRFHSNHFRLTLLMYLKAINLIWKSLKLILMGEIQNFFSFWL